MSPLFEKVCGKSAEYVRVPETVQCMLPHLVMNNEQTRETILVRCPMMFLSFLTATAYLSWTVCFVAPFHMQDFLLQQPSRFHIRPPC